MRLVGFIEKKFVTMHGHMNLEWIFIHDIAVISEQLCQIMQDL